MKNSIYIQVEKVDIDTLLDDELPGFITCANLKLLKEIVPVRARMADNEQLLGIILLVHNSIIKEIPE